MPCKKLEQEKLSRRVSVELVSERENVKKQEAA